MIQKWNNFHSWYPFQKIWFKSNVPAKNYRNRVLRDSIRAKIPKGRLPHSKRINFYTMVMASLNESEYFDSCCTLYMWWLGFWPEIGWLKVIFLHLLYNVLIGWLKSDGNHFGGRQEIFAPPSLCPQITVNRDTDYSDHLLVGIWQTLQFIGS